MDNQTAAVLLLLFIFLYWRRESLPFIGGGDAKSSSTAAGSATKSHKPKVLDDDNEDDFVVQMREGKKQLAVFFGSQTGTANEYALRIAKEAKSRFGVTSLVCDPEEYEVATLDRVPSDKAVIFVMALYGDGEPTDNAEEMWNFLFDDDVTFSNGGQSLDNLNYVMFGLGNTTYEKYQGAARKLDARLEELGARRIGERGEADEIVGTEMGYLDWKDGMWAALADRLELQEGEAGDIADFVVTEVPDHPDEKVYRGELSPQALKAAHGGAPSGSYDAKNPYAAPVATSRELFAMEGVDGDRNCVHLELDISGTNISYQHGDHVAIWPSNPDMAVERFLSVLGLNDKRDTPIEIKALDPQLAAVPFPCPATYESIFRHYLEISAIASRQTLAMLAKYAPTPEARATMERWGNDKEAYHREIEGARVRLGEALQLAAGDDPHVSTTATKWDIPFDRIISLVPRQKPRFYSISSSSKLHPDTIHVTAVILRYQTPDSKLHGNNPRWIYGAGTNFLLNVQQARLGGLAGGVTPIRLDGMPTTTPTYRIEGPRAVHAKDNVYRIPMHTRRSTFRLPQRTNVPVIMIGPGTGVAPFRGFVQERVAQARQSREKRGPDALKDWAPMWLFYGCRNDSDFLYKEEWPEYAKELDGKFSMHTALSRGPDRKPDGSKIYVQDLIWDQREALVRAITQQGAYIYICGDAKNMAKAVEHTFAKMLAEYRGGSAEMEGAEEIKNLKDRKRFLTDVWS
ncbi:NADPH--cytochrome reductase [Trichosporon asahii var. asahii CBS 2479]|uniref:NADPH--cytochrome P450 reductase n=1 Tax=Trichosporon asahii var. asahii (strain ATCC 90039 / CBS 2479 / JCM 2466 / KCTC 7840 / NBRC 103889/ NCYC 2677 / UAMH 7654) TaxID=1186058 RepID=J6FAK4_TRIAS|nr:NADPH--cytochrome reductase [Trichosporon asahii var. asahii CBS 2479]EJT52232.1 NADPH--cytochrome reductase [Trichosporon asahii var. asahii CBS 2479]